MRWADHETTRSRQSFFDDIAPLLVESVAGPLPAWTGPRRLSRQVAFHGDEDVLVIVSWPDATQASVDGALAWGLALGGDRDVVLVLPASRAHPTLQRLPWVNVPVRVSTFDVDESGRTCAMAIPARSEVLAEVASWGQRGSAGAEELGVDRADWVRELVAWADQHAQLSRRDRQSYLAWHSAGRQVLKIARTRSGVIIHAGVRYTKPTPGQPEPPPALTIRAPLTPDQLADLTATIGQAVRRRQAGDDAGHEEHRLQHALQTAFDANGELFGLTHLRREFPAWRPGRSPGFIDFLGATPDHTVHIVETKLDNDLMLALQGLDYWIWACANPDALNTAFGEPMSMTPVIDFVVGANKTTKVVGPYTLRQLEAFDDGIEWRFHVVTDWRTALRLDTLPSRQVPCPPLGWEPVVPPRLAHRIRSN